MNALDLSPLFRTAIGFDRLARTLETARTQSDGNGYPPASFTAAVRKVITVCGKGTYSGKRRR